MTKIYHNPKCSKSRQTLQLLEEKGIEPEIILYMEHPLKEKDIKDLLSLLGMEALDLVRKGEAEYKELKAKHGDPDNATVIKWMAKHPRLIQRPIVVKGKKARLGRPPEDVLDII